MAKEAIAYLDQDLQNTVEEWVEGILPLVEKFPQLAETDLVVEGGVGNGRITAHIARRLFPNALYIGTDIADAFSGYLSRLRGEIDDETLERVVIANRNPVADMKRTIVYGNCFDGRLINDIMKKTGKQHPLLISKNSLFALLDKNANPWDRKDEADFIPLGGILRRPNLYQAQIHLGVNWNDSMGVISDTFLKLETTAQREGWTTERFDVGILLFQNKS
jgi:hypothetical protein